MPEGGGSGGHTHWRVDLYRHEEQHWPMETSSAIAQRQRRDVTQRWGLRA